jgi:hypothetical protein
MNNFFTRMGVYARKNHITDAIFPIMLAAVLMDAFLYIYIEKYFSGWAIGCTVAIIGLFALFFRLRKIKFFGGLIYVFLGLAVLVAGGFIIGSSGQYGYSFIVWFFSGAVFQATTSAFLAAFCLLFTFFFSSVIFYFTQSVYRKHWILLISLIPFTAFAKMVLTPPSAFVILAAGLELFIYLQNKRKDIAKSGYVAGRKSILTVYGDFAIALVILVAIIPKPNDTPYWAAFEEALGRYTFGNFSGTSLSGALSMESGNADNMNRMDNRDLYTVITAEPNYMKIQSFPYYNAEDDNWYITGELLQNRDNYDWQSSAKLLDFDRYAAAILRAEENRPGLLALYGLEADRELLESIAGQSAETAEPEEDSTDETDTGSERELTAKEQLYADEPESESLPENSENSETDYNTGAKDDDRVYPAYVTANNFGSYYAIAPFRTTEIGGANTENYRFYSPYGGGLFSLKSMPENFSYSINYHGEREYLDLGLQGTAMAALSADSYTRFLSDVIAALPSTSADSAIMKAFYNEANDAKNWTGYDSYNSERVKVLADEITVGLSTDFEKASALERYFSENGFTYISGYNAPTDSVEYFLFEDKTGSCSDFATAFTVMAHMEGIPVRYTEGFIPKLEEGETTVYKIRTADAHAYPEVYLNGGWVRFEPTVSDTDPFETPEDDGTALDSMTLLVTIIVVLSLAVIVVLFIILYPHITERIFRIRYLATALSSRRTGNIRAVLLLYQRLGYHIRKKTDFPEKVKTAGELKSYCNVRYQTDIDDLTNPYNRGAFGDRYLTKPDRKAAYACYKNIVACIRAGKKVLSKKEKQLVAKRKKAAKRKAREENFLKGEWL